MKNKNNTKARRSMKGKWGKVGAPPKATKFPKTPFTMATLFGRNTNQCELSLRNKVDAMLLTGALIQLKSRKQAHGAVGRPKAVFIAKASFNKEKHEKLGAPAKPVTRKARTIVAASDTTVAPVTAPAPENTAAVPLVPIETVPVETAAPIVTETVPATEPANVIPVPTDSQPVEQPVAQAA
jgi:hypothetical protein